MPDRDTNFYTAYEVKGLIPESHVEQKSKLTYLLIYKTKYSRPQAYQVFCQVVEYIHSALFLTIIINDITDVSNQEDVVIYFVWVDDVLERHEYFVGLQDGLCRSYSSSSYNTECPA